MISFNSFKGIIESKLFPHSRTLRTGFWRKLGDTLSVLAGEGFVYPKTMRLGIFDYLSFGVGVFSTYLARKLLSIYKTNNTAIKILGSFYGLLIVLPVLAIAAALICGRVAFALGLMLLSSPIVAVVHAISRIPANKLFKSINALPAQIEKESKSKVITRYPSTLGVVLKRIGCRSLDDLKIEQIAAQPGENQLFRLVGLYSDRRGVITSQDLFNSDLFALNPDNICNRFNK